MHCTRIPWQGTLIVLTTLSMLTGCGERPPDADELVLYFQNARVGGKVRRQWPAGQAYVDKVLRADAKVRHGLAPLAALVVPASLPDLKADLWRSSQKVAEKLKAANELLSPASTQQREAALADLAAAVAALPDAPLEVFRDSAARAAFVDRAWEALRWQDQDIRQVEEELRPLAQQHAAWLAALQKQAETLKTRAGAASDAEIRAAGGRLAAAHAALRTSLQARQGRLDDAVRRQLADATTRLAELRDEKQALREQFKQRAKTDSDVRRLAWIEDRIDYEMARQRTADTDRKKIEKREREAALTTQPTEVDLLKAATALAADLARAKP